MNLIRSALFGVKLGNKVGDASEVVAYPCECGCGKWLVETSNMHETMLMRESTVRKLAKFHPRMRVIEP